MDKMLTEREENEVVVKKQLGRPKSNLRLLRPPQIKRPKIGTRLIEDEWLLLKHLGISHPRIPGRTKTITAFLSEMIMKFLVEKPWLHPQYDYADPPDGTSFFKKAPTPSKVKKDSKKIILTTIDLQEVRSPSGKIISEKRLLALYKHCVKLLEEEKSEVNVKTTRVYGGTPQQILEQKNFDDAVLKTKKAKYWAEREIADEQGNVTVFRGLLSEATVAFSMIRWILDTVYSPDLSVSQYPAARQYDEHSKLEDSIIFGVAEGFNLYSDEDSEPGETKQEKSE